MRVATRKTAMVGESGYDRLAGDRYYTQPWITRALLRVVRFRGKVWEPACGRGDMVDVLREAGYDTIASDIAGATLGCVGASELDFLTHGSPGDATFSIVTNPPYAHAEAFIRKSLELTQRSGGQVAMLLRNEYDSASRRRDLFERESFACKLVLTKRPQWIEEMDGKPRHNFAFYLWDWNHTGPATIRWLP